MKFIFKWDPTCLLIIINAEETRRAYTKRNLRIILASHLSSRFGELTSVITMAVLCNLLMCTVNLSLTSFVSINYFIFFHQQHLDLSDRDTVVCLCD